jgi:phosphoenolpyruvate---glycerone phosphotransferase subunit DhaK
MQKLLNDPFRAVDEMLEGALCAHGSAFELLPSGRGVVTRPRSATRRTGVITGGGSGHEPAFFGYLGPGLADGVAVGNVFASPSARPIVEVARDLAMPEGVVFIYGNYEGDVMNFDLAAELLADEGIPSETVLVTDDVASAPSGREPERRGVAGDVVVLKAAGARADEGGSLHEVVEAARLANDRTRTVGVGLAPCTLPTAEAPTFEIAEGEIDVGMGVHGEAGIRRTRMVSADEMTETLVTMILDDRPPAAGEPVQVIVNTLGSTTLMEAYVVLRRVTSLLGERGVPIHRSLVGEYITSLEMGGLSVTLTALDEELTRLLDAPALPLFGPRSWL